MERIIYNFEFNQFRSIRYIHPHHCTKHPSFAWTHEHIPFPGNRLHHSIPHSQCHNQVQLWLHNQVVQLFFRNKYVRREVCYIQYSSIWIPLTWCFDTSLAEARLEKNNGSIQYFILSRNNTLNCRLLALHYQYWVEYQNLMHLHLASKQEMTLKPIQRSNYWPFFCVFYSQGAY